MFCVTDIAFYVIQKLTDFLAKKTRFVAKRERVFVTRAPTTTCNTRKATYKNLNIFKRLNLLDECNRTAKVKLLKTGKT